MTRSRRLAAHAARRVVAASLALLVVAPVAGAQHAVAPAGVTTVAPSASSAANARAAVRVDDRGDRIFDHMASGALVGAVAGLAYALILHGNAGNRGEGPPVFVLLPAAGVVLGAVVGTAVGIARTQ